jgi:ubiquinone/menaquinone biosynthesis C-methylase UbiE
MIWGILPLEAARGAASASLLRGSITMDTRRPRLAVSMSVLVFALVLGGDLIARQLASRPAEDWIKRLERPERVANLKIDYIVEKLALKPGDVVVDIGAGAGVFTLPLAKAVGPSGTVYAVEIDQAFLDHIEMRAREQQVGNVRTVLGKFADPNLPTRDVDMALFHDVLHHIADRAGYLKALARYMKPTGRVAIIELPADGSHRDDPKLVVTREQVDRWMADAGFHPIETIDGLTEGKWFVIYGRH